MTRLALIADLDRCTGCHSCVVACKEENETPAGVSLIRVVQVGPEGDFPHLNMYYLPLTCQQCGQPACAASCPGEAIGRDENGIVSIDGEKCDCCGLCVESCPYGGVVLDAAQGSACKCELCDGLLSVGHPPACVAACPTKALRVVDLDAAGSGPTGQDAGRRGRPLFALKPSLGTHPSGCFILSRQEWRDRY